MKNRKKFSQPSKANLKRSESQIEKSNSEVPLNTKIFSSVSLQQNLELFQKYSSFPRPIRNCGDAETYFRQTLRSYDPFDINFIRRVRNQLTKASKSVDTLKKKKSSGKQKTPRKLFTLKKTSSSKLNTDKKRSAPKLSTSRASEKKKFEEIDTDIFYSPSNHSLSSQNSTLVLKQNQSEQSEFQSPKTPDRSEEDNDNEKMAEEEDFTEDFEEDTAPPVSQPVPDIIEEDEEDDELKEVGDIIKQASAELAEAVEENLVVEKEIDEEEYDEDEDEEEGPKEAGDGSVFKFDPAIDSAVLRELEDAERQAKATAAIIYELKTRVTELLKKDTHTEAEARELEEKNKELKAQMLLFEEKTKRIQHLIAQTNLFDKMIPPQTPVQQPHCEDVLPKVVVCGMTEHNIPKLILCDNKKGRTCVPGDCGADPMSVVPKFAKRLNDSYSMQEKLAAENADLEGMRYKLQSDLLSKDQTIECLQRKLCSIQCEMRMLCKENTELNDKIRQICSQRQLNKNKKMPCKKGSCPAEIEGRLTEYSETTKLLEKQLCDMENDVKTMQNELSAVQTEREHLEQHKKVIICPPCHPPCGPPCSPCAPCIIPCADQQLRELRQQYCQLQDDFKSKVTEVGGLRADNEKLRNGIKDAEEARKLLDERVRDLERTIKAMKGENKMGTKEQIIELEQQLSVAKQRFREAQDELEELRSFIQDQQSQLDDYRNKYLEAQQEVEEQRRHIDMLEMDANRVNEQVTLEIQRVKNQFQEKLQELLPLPELLKTTQLKLQEVQQMHLLAERNNEALNRDLQLYKDKIAEITGQMDKVRSDNALGQSEKDVMLARLQEMETRINELEEQNFTQRQDLDKAQEAYEETDRELQTKLHEVAQLSAQLDTVREESARQVARNKDRCETVRRSMQNQISDLERQLAQSRAQAKAAQKDRDEIRQKMQAQINNLHENFEDAQMRIRNLQAHVNFLKDSYNTNVPGLADADSSSDMQDPCLCGRDF